jgi:hypothetical protein
MRILLILITFIFSGVGFSQNDKEIKNLFVNYELIFNQKKLDLIPKVFTEKFLNSAGGISSFKKKIIEHKDQKVEISKHLKISKGSDPNTYYVTPTNDKTENIDFIIKLDKGSLKVDGTISNEN